MFNQIFRDDTVDTGQEFGNVYPYLSTFGKSVVPASITKQKCIFVLDLDKTCIYYDEDNKFSTEIPKYYIRPGIERLLALLKSTFKRNPTDLLMVLWSTGEKTYIHDALLKTGLGIYFDLVWDRNICKQSLKKTGSSKHLEYLLSHKIVGRWITKRCGWGFNDCEKHVNHNSHDYKIKMLRQSINMAFDLSKITTVIIDDLLESNIGDSSYTLKFRCPPFDATIMQMWNNFKLETFATPFWFGGQNYHQQQQQQQQQQQLQQQQHQQQGMTLEAKTKLLKCLRYFDDEVIISLDMALFSPLFS
jgi:hypothetical protein